MTMKKDRWKLFVCVSVGLTVGAWTANADILLDDTFADGSRGETSLPTESAVWVGTPGSVTMGAGSLAYAQSTSSQKLWTYFAGNGAPVTLNAGDKLKATIEFTPRVGLYDSSSKNFRFGLFNDPTDAQVVTDVNSDSGGSGQWTDSEGYAVHFALSTGATASSSPSLGKRTDQSNSSLLGSGSAYTLETGGNAVVATLDTLYTISLELNRTGAEEMTVTFDISDGGGSISTHTIVDNAASAFNTTNGIAVDFDQLFFRFSKAEATADVIDISRIQVEYTAIPEPSTIGLIGVAGIGLLVARRRLKI